MLGKTLILVSMLLAILGWGCAASHEIKTVSSGTPVPSDIKIKVTDVTNDTRELFDIDVIGLLWDSLNEALRKENVLWVRGMETVPLKLEAHVVRYQKGSAWKRWLLPGFGSTVLVVKCELKDGDRLVASVEAQDKVSTGEGLTIGAWKTIFVAVAEDVVREIHTKMRSGA